MGVKIYSIRLNDLDPTFSQNKEERQGNFGASPLHLRKNVEKWRGWKFSVLEGTGQSKNSGVCLTSSHTI